MRRFKDKLRDNRGVTVLMALFALLVASMVCIVILGASVTTVKQSKADQQHEQNMLLLQSAGELISSNLNYRDGSGNGVAVTYKTITTYTRKDGENGSYSYQDGVSTHVGPTASENCLLKPELAGAVRGILDSPTEDYVSSTPFEISLQGAASVLAGESGGSNATVVEGVDGARVEVNFTLRHGNHNAQTEGTGLDYQLVFTFTLDSAAPGVAPQTLFLKMSGSKVTERSISGTRGDEEIVETDTDTYSWSNPVFYLADGTEV